jgi:hypothetical protein
MKYLQGKFIPKNPEKYVGDVDNISFRSSWERKAMIFFDDNPNVLKWGSEELIIMYVSPVDDRPHRYFPDFILSLKSRDGLIKKYVVEVKPAIQCEPPKQKKKTQRMLMEVKTYAVNQAKWEAARKWCASNGFEFTILTERELGIKK